MKNYTRILLFLLITGIFWACTSPTPTEETDDKTPPTETRSVSSDVQTVDGLTIKPLEGSPAYPGAQLSLDAPTATDEGSYTFDFEVANYELGAQTANAGENGLANSGKGQHIHFIVDNGPYSAHYEPNFTKEFEPGRHVVLAFLSRSYHESVKEPGAFWVQEVVVGEAAGESPDFTAPHMFYSRPKGTYKGSDTEQLLLDFYLLNIDLSPDGYKVKATINGSEFMLTEWKPYVVEGLPMGEVMVKLELLDAEGNAVPGPFNTVERTVTLAPADA